MKNLKLLFKNIIEIILFELVFKTLTIFIMMPIFFNLFKVIMKITGYSYLTIENIFSFILNPITILLILVLLFIMCFYSLFDIGTLIILFDSAKQEKKVKLIDSIKLSFKKSLKVFRLKNIGFILYILILVPFVNLGVSSSLITVIYLPEFIEDFILNNTFLLTVSSIVYIILLIVNLKWIYSLHYYFLEDKNFSEAKKLSIKMSNKNTIKDFFVLLLSQIIVYLLFVVVVFLLVILFGLFAYIFKNIKIIESVFISIIILLVILGIFIAFVVNTAISYYSVSLLFYKHKEEKNEKIYPIKLPIRKKKHNFTPFYIICIIAVFIMSCFIYGVLNGYYNFNIEQVKNMEISAHRGASKLYPENTMSAFKGAKELGADWIELDVQQSKDKVIIVSHDSNFIRTAGVDEDVWDLTYNEISKLDVGSFKNEKFKGEKIPTLEEVIVWAKDNNIKLNIELKPTGHEVNFEQGVVKLINKYDFKNNCIITSQAYSVLENTKKIDNSITTAYVMSIAIGDIIKLDKADIFSLECSNITNNSVKTIHSYGKEVYGWTVDSDETINKMIDCGVDNIITDDIVLGKKIVIERKSSNVLREIIRFIVNNFY